VPRSDRIPGGDGIVAGRGATKQEIGFAARTLKRHWMVQQTAATSPLTAGRFSLQAR